MSNKYQVIIAENKEVLFDCLEGDTSAGESFLVDSLEEAERILEEHTAVPGKGGVIIPPDGKSSLMIPPMRTRDDIGAAEAEFFDKVWYDRQQMLSKRESARRHPDINVRRMEEEYGKAHFSAESMEEASASDKTLRALADTPPGRVLDRRNVHHQPPTLKGKTA